MNQENIAVLIRVLRSLRRATVYRHSATSFVLTLAFAAPAFAEAQPLGATPSAEQFPKIEFVFEERVTLAAPVVLGQTALGHRQYIPITGGTIAGPKLNGRVIPGGWDFQLRYQSGCGTLTADYFLEADDGTVIHILNESFNCGLPGQNGERSFFRPKFEAPEGPHGWLTRGSFIATLELDTSGAPPAPAPAEAASQQPPLPRLGGIRIKVYQIK
jgi:hypothetical protein